MYLCVCIHAHVCVCVFKCTRVFLCLCVCVCVHECTLVCHLYHAGSLIGFHWVALLVWTPGIKWPGLGHKSCVWSQSAAGSVEGLTTSCWPLGVLHVVSWGSQHGSMGKRPGPNEQTVFKWPLTAGLLIWPKQTLRSTMKNLTSDGELPWSHEVTL